MNALLEGIIFGLDGPLEGKGSFKVAQHPHPTPCDQTEPPPPPSPVCRKNVLVYSGN